MKMDEAEGFVQISPTFLPLTRFLTLIASVEHGYNLLNTLINKGILVFLSLLSSSCCAFYS